MKWPPCEKSRENHGDNIWCGACGAAHRSGEFLSVQRMTMRDIESGDAPAIARIVRRTTVLHRQVDGELEGILYRLLREQRVIGVVVEQADGSGDGSPAMVGVTFSGFLEPAFARAYRAAPTPLLTSQALASALAENCLLLDPRGQAAGNLADGLDLAVLEPLAAQFGPSPAEVATPLPPEDIPDEALRCPAFAAARFMGR